MAAVLAFTNPKPAPIRENERVLLEHFRVIDAFTPRNAEAMLRLIAKMRELAVTYGAPPEAV